MRISVCMCTCDRHELLERALRSLETMKLDGLNGTELELIVVDNSPTGEARAVCEVVSTSLPISLHFTEEPRRGISFARNKAVEVALSRGADLIAFVDDDDWPEPDWLSHLLNRHKETGANLVFGSWRVDAGANVPPWLKDLSDFADIECRITNKYGIDLPSRIASCNVMIMRELLEQQKADGPVFLPEFSSIGGEDMDFFVRAIKHGATFAIAENSIVNRHYTSDRMTRQGILKLAFRYGNGPMHVARKHCTPGEVRRRGRKALRKVMKEMLLLPAYAFSKPDAMRHIYKITKSLGALHGYTGRRYDYYH